MFNLFMQPVWKHSQQQYVNMLIYLSGNIYYMPTVCQVMLNGRVNEYSNFSGSWEMNKT